MKIVQIIDTLQVGGAERVLVTLANLLYRQGHTVTVITLLEPGPLAVQLLPGISVRVLQRGWKWNLGKMRQLVQWCRVFDVVHVHSSHNLRYVFLAAQLFRLNKKIFFHEHFGDIEIDASVHWHQRFIYPKTILIGVSQKICDWAIQQLPMSAKRVYLLRNIVPKYQVAEHRIVNREIELFRLLVVANIRPTKHIEFAIELLKVLNNKKRTQLTIIGQVADLSYYERLQQLIDRYKLQNQVEFVHDCTNVQPILKDYDLALHTAKSESGPLVIIEYLAQGLPFVTYQTGEIVSLVAAELPDHVMPHFDQTRWVSAIEALMQKERACLAKRLTAIYDTYFSEEAYYQQCLQIYQENLA